MQLNRSEIFLRFFCRGRTETFVILDGPAFTLVVDELPVFVFRQRVKYARLLALRRLNDGRDKLQQKTRNFQQRWEVRVEKVDQQTFDVRTIVILIRHDHQLPISQRLDGFFIVRFAMLQPQNLFDVGDFRIVLHLIKRSVANVQQLPSQRKHPVVVSANDGQTGNGQCFGGIPLG